MMVASAFRFLALCAVAVALALPDSADRCAASPPPVDCSIANAAPSVAEIEQRLDVIGAALLDPTLSDDQLLVEVRALTAFVQFALSKGADLAPTQSRLTVAGNLFYLSRRLFRLIDLDAVAVRDLVVLLADHQVTGRALPSFLVGAIMNQFRDVTPAHLDLVQNVLMARYDFSVLDHVPSGVLNQITYRNRVHAAHPDLPQYNKLRAVLSESLRPYLLLHNFADFGLDDEPLEAFVYLPQIGCFGIWHRIFRVPADEFARYAPFMFWLIDETRMERELENGQFALIAEVLRYPAVRYIVSQAQTLSLRFIYMACHVAIQYDQPDLLRALLAIPGAAADLRAHLDALSADWRVRGPKLPRITGIRGLYVLLQKRYPELRAAAHDQTPSWYLDLDVDDMVVDDTALARALDCAQP